MKPDRLRPTVLIWIDPEFSHDAGKRILGQAGPIWMRCLGDAQVRPPVVGWGMDAAIEMIVGSAGFHRSHAFQVALSSALAVRPQADWRWRKKVTRKLRRDYALPLREPKHHD